MLPRVTQEFALVGALGTLFFFLHHTSAKTPHNAWAPLFFAAIIYLCAIDRGSLIKRVLETRPLKAIGRWSYSIYMVHMMFAVGTYQLVGRVWSGHITVGVFEDLVATPVWIGDLILVAYLGLVIAVSALTYAFVETPWREYGRRMCLKI